MKNPELAKQEDQRKVQRGKIIRKKIPHKIAHKTQKSGGPLSSEEPQLVTAEDQQKSENEAAEKPMLEFSPQPEQIAQAEKLNKGGFKKTTEQITHELKLEAMLNKHR